MRVKTVTSTRRIRAEVGRSTGTAAGRVLTRPRHHTSPPDAATDDRNSRASNNRKQRAATQARPTTSPARAQTRPSGTKRRFLVAARADASCVGNLLIIAVRNNADHPPSSSERFAAAGGRSESNAAARPRCGRSSAGIATSAAVSKEPPERRCSGRRQSIVGTNAPPPSMRPVETLAIGLRGIHAMAKALRPYRGLRSNGEIRGIQREHEGPAPSRAGLERTTPQGSIIVYGGWKGREESRRSHPDLFDTSVQCKNSQMGAEIVFWVGEAWPFAAAISEFRAV